MSTVIDYFYDFEFYENGETIDPISIGICSSDGRELYLVNGSFDWRNVPEGHWLWDNVAPHLPALHPELLEYVEDRAVVSYEVFARQVKKFLLYGVPENPDDKVTYMKLWGWFSAYDHVTLMQLWGTMVKRPVGIPMYTNDLRQLHVYLGEPKLPAQIGTEHHALSDAKHNKRMYESLCGYFNLRK